MNKRTGIAIGLMVALLALFMLFGREKTDEGPAPDGAGQQPAKAAPPKTGPANATALKKEKAALKSAQDLAKVELSVGLRRRPVTTDSSGTHVKVKIKSLARCDAGDLDAIDLDMRADTNAQLIASLEPLDKGGAGGSFQKLDPATLRKGTELSFKLPRVTQPTVFGLYVCKDSNNAGKCAAKRAADVNEVFADHTHVQGVKHTPKAPDRTYFFQMMMIDAASSANLDSLSVSDDDYKTLGSYFKQRGAADGAALADKTKTLNRTLVSMDVPAAEKLVTIVLPYYDPEICKKLVTP